MATYTWYLTDVSRPTSNGNPAWQVDGASTEVKVFFGTQAEWDNLTAIQKDAYDIYIIDANGSELVDADELRAAMSRYSTENNLGYTFADNQGYLGTSNIDHDGDGGTANVPSVGLDVGGGSIQSSTDAVVITLQEMDTSFFSANYKGGVGNFKPFHPGTLTPDPPPCFVRGTLIRTPDGDCRVEDLAAGDLVVTVDHGPQPVRVVLSQTLDAARLARDPQLRPIRISAGALGPGIPTQDLLVSPQHRMLVRSKIAQRMFGVSEILVAAKQLLSIDGIDLVEDFGEVEYFHVLLEQHEVLIANGAESESLYTGPEALKGVGSAALEEIFEIFPQLRDGGGVVPPVRPLAEGRRGRQLAQRHRINHQALVIT